MLPQIETELLKLHLAAEDGAEYVFPNVSGQTNLRTYLERIIRNAGVKLWPKLWHNLRASGATDFARTLPSHVAAEICGHTEEIAKEHYWQVSDSDLNLAIEKLGSPKLAQKLAHDDGLNGPQTSRVDSKALGPETKKPQVSLGFDVICQLLSEAGFSHKMGGTELESVTSTMSTCESLDENPAKDREKQEDAERLHQCLHQIGKMIESHGPESLADALAQLLGEEHFKRLADALSRRVADG